MAKERMFDFCTSCRKDTSYKMQKKTVQKVIRDKTYDFKITVAVCDECGEEMDIPGLLDANIKSIDDENKVHLRLTGACGSCPMAVMTLKMGVEQYLKETCPEITEVVQEE